jgi:hypothetical protein
MARLRGRQVGVVGDDLSRTLLGGLPAAKPGVAGRGVEDPLCVIEHEVVLGVFGPCTRSSSLVPRSRLARSTPRRARPRASLQGELHYGMAYSRELLSGAGVVDGGSCSGLR